MSASIMLGRCRDASLCVPCAGQAQGITILCVGVVYDHMDSPDRSTSELTVSQPVLRCSPNLKSAQVMVTATSVAWPTQAHRKCARRVSSFVGVVTARTPAPYTRVHFLCPLRPAEALNWCWCMFFTMCTTIIMLKRYGDSDIHSISAPTPPLEAPRAILMLAATPLLWAPAWVDNWERESECSRAGLTAHLSAWTSAPP